jgi:hypothetical protein
MLEDAVGCLSLTLRVLRFLEEPRMSVVSPVSVSTETEASPALLSSAVALAVVRFF